MHCSVWDPLTADPKCDGQAVCVNCASADVPCEQAPQQSRSGLMNKGFLSSSQVLIDEALMSTNLTLDEGLMTVFIV